MSDKLEKMIRSADEFLEISSNPKTFIPNFVNIAFACELYMKSILYAYSSNYAKTHNLQTLYKSIVKYINEKNFLQYLLDHTYLKSDLSDLDSTKQDLYSMLEEHKNLFKEWRYIFDLDNDYNAVNLVLRDFALALQDYIHTEIKHAISTRG